MLPYLIFSARANRSPRGAAYATMARAARTRANLISGMGYGRSNGVMNRSDSRSDSGQQVKRGRNARNMFSQVPLSTSETEVYCEEQLRKWRGLRNGEKNEIWKRRLKEWKRGEGSIRMRKMIGIETSKEVIEDLIGWFSGNERMKMRMKDVLRNVIYEWDSWKEWEPIK